MSAPTPKSPTSPIDSSLRIHNLEIARAKAAIPGLVGYRDTYARRSKVLYWVCHIIALVSIAAGLSTAGFGAASAEVPSWARSLLGFIAAIYSMLKYVKLEEHRFRFQRRTMCLSVISTQLEDRMAKMQTALDDGFQPDKDAEEWKSFSTFSKKCQKLLESLDLGVDDVQKEMKSFDDAEVNMILGDMAVSPVAKTS